MAGGWGKTIFEITDENGNRVGYYDAVKNEIVDTPWANKKGKTYTGSKNTQLARTAKANSVRRNEIRSFDAQNNRKRRRR